MYTIFSIPNTHNFICRSRKRFRVDNFLFFLLIYCPNDNKKATKLMLCRFKKHLFYLFPSERQQQDRFLGFQDFDFFL